MSLNKTDREMIAKLQSGKPGMIAEVLKNFRSDGSVVLIPYLLDIVTSGKFSSIEDEILKLVSDIKDKKAALIIANALKKHDYKNNIDAVIAACWQSRLDFSPHLPVFAEYFFKYDYQTSIEAFTVIEESLHNSTVAQRKECLKIIEKHRLKITETLKPLFIELYKLLKNSLEFTIDG